MTKSSPSCPIPEPVAGPTADLALVPADDRNHAGDDDRLATELRYLVLAAQREGNRRLSQELRPLGLTSGQAEILLVLSAREPLTLIEVGRHIVCESGPPSRLIDTLVRRGLVEREPGMHDRRVVLLRLSPKGRDLLPAVQAVDRAVTEATSGQFSELEKRVMSDALRKLLKETPSGDAVARRFGTPPPVRAGNGTRRPAVSSH